MEKKEFLTLSHYKEPLRKIPRKEGYGYFGAVQVTVDGEKVQCHICGKLFKNVSTHAHQAHKIKMADYKERFGLAYTTRLISEKERDRMKQATLDWLATLSEEDKREYRRRFVEGNKNKKNSGTQGKKIRLETKNKRGTCPDQLLEKIKEVANTLGYTPSKHEFIGECGTQRYMHLIYKTFGSWRKALQMLGMKKEQKQNGKFVSYSDEELLEYLQIFYQENDKIPTYTDFRRGLLPGYQVYIRRFGTISNARELAGIE